jgi:hypothetical protein
LGACSHKRGRDLLEVIDDRYQADATIVATSLPVDQLHGIIGAP